MAKLEDIPKGQFFKAPDGYFDQLPARILSRVSTPRDPVSRTAFVLQYAFPAMLLAAVLFYYFAPGPDAESMLSSVQTTELIDYLHESGLTTEDLLEDMDFSSDDLEAIENEVYNLNLQDMDDETLDLELNTL
jgi:hypothetical protein